MVRTAATPAPKTYAWNRARWRSADHAISGISHTNTSSWRYVKHTDRRRHQPDQPRDGAHDRQLGEHVPRQDEDEAPQRPERHLTHRVEGTAGCVLARITGVARPPQRGAVSAPLATARRSFGVSTFLAPPLQECPASSSDRALVLGGWSSRCYWRLSRRPRRNGQVCPPPPPRTPTTRVCAPATRFASTCGAIPR